MAPGSAPRVPYITLEEHWLSPVSAAEGEGMLNRRGFPQAKIDDLKDVSPDGGRLAEMDKHNISVQVVSHVAAPKEEGNPSVAECRQSNDELAKKISGEAMSKRFKGFARLPMEDAEASAAELRRCVKELGFVGSLVDNTLDVPSTRTKSVFFDHRSYDAVWQACCDLDVPFYLHPTYPPEGPETSQYRFEPSEGGSFPQAAGMALSAFGFGWHVDTALHFLRLVVAGVFDRFPTLKFVLGHQGESMPFFLERTVRSVSMTVPDLKRGLIQVWNENVWITTSGFWGKAAVAASLQVTSSDRIMFSVDFPFSTNEQGVKWMQWLWESGIVTEEQWHDIAYRNSAKLLRLSA